MGKLNDFIAMLSSNEDALLGVTSSVPNDIAQTGLGNGGMNGIMQEIDGLDFSCMGTGTNESSFNGTLGTKFLGSPAVENMSGLHLLAPATQDSSLRGSYGVVTELEVSVPLVNNNIVKPTWVTTTLLNRISLSSLLSSSCGYTPSLPARFGPSAPGPMSPARSTSSINPTESLRPTVPLDNPSPSANDDSVTQMDTDIHDNSTVSSSATAPNVEDAEPQSPQLKAMSNGSSMSSVMLLWDNEVDCQICKNPAPTGKENVRLLCDCKATQRANGPNWHDTTKAELLSNDFGSDWEDCISQWHEFEGMVTMNSVSDVIIHPLKCTYTLFMIQNGQFHSGSRPKKLSSWLSSKSRLPFKSKNWVPEEIDVFGNKMEPWWNQAQSKW